jgi:hypothetical protein
MKIVICLFLLHFLVFVSLENVSGEIQTILRRPDVEKIDLWELANKNRDLLRFSTLFTAQNIRDLLSSDDGINKAIEWCKQTAVSRVYVESFRDGYTAEKSALEKSKKAFLDAGIDVSGCVTTTVVGKKSTGWSPISCFTDIPTQENLQKIFEYTASMFDEIMIDDFWFTDCECDECVKAKGDKSWSEYRNDLMVKLSRERILAPARKVNPNVKIIIKYPQWYDQFHNRGYEVVRESQDYDKIWVGTETRDPDNKQWGLKAQYEAYYIMRWLGAIGGEKTGGGWFDPYGTSPVTYVEQARQTVLADAKECLLFCYGSLLEDTGPANIEKLRTEIPRLFKLAEIVRDKPIKGVLAPKPPNSDAYKEQYIFDFVGMLGLPLVPSPEIKPAESVFLSVHAFEDRDIIPKLFDMVVENKPLLVTDGFVDMLKGQVDLSNHNVQILKVNGDPKSITNMSRASLLDLRNMMLKPFGIEFDAPSKVSLYLIGDKHVVIENFNDENVDVQLCMTDLIDAKSLIKLPIDADINVKVEGNAINAYMSPRSMVALQISKSR